MSRPSSRCKPGSSTSIALPNQVERRCNVLDYGLRQNDCGVKVLLVDGAVSCALPRYLGRHFPCTRTESKTFIDTPESRSSTWPSVEFEYTLIEMGIGFTSADAVTPTTKSCWAPTVRRANAWPTTKTVRDSRTNPKEIAETRLRSFRKRAKPSFTPDATCGICFLTACTNSSLERLAISRNSPLRVGVITLP